MGISPFKHNLARYAPARRKYLLIHQYDIISQDCQCEIALNNPRFIDVVRDHSLEARTDAIER
jgi:hypothetical protein